MLVAPVMIVMFVVATAAALDARPELAPQLLALPQALQQDLDFCGQRLPGRIVLVESRLTVLHPKLDRLHRYGKHIPVTLRNILDAALEFIKADPDKPFYVNAWFSDPHATLNPSSGRCTLARRASQPRSLASTSRTLSERSVTATWIRVARRRSTR